MKTTELTMRSTLIGLLHEQERRLDLPISTSARYAGVHTAEIRRWVRELEARPTPGERKRPES